MESGARRGFCQPGLVQGSVPTLQPSPTAEVQPWPGHRTPRSPVLPSVKRRQRRCPLGLLWGLNIRGDFSAEPRSWEWAPHIGITSRGTTLASGPHSAPSGPEGGRWGQRVRGKRFLDPICSQGKSVAVQALTRCV